MNSKSLRKRRAVLDRISSIQLANIKLPDGKRIYDIYDEYIDSAPFTEEEIETFHALLDHRLITNVSEYVEPLMEARTVRVAEVENLITVQPFPDVRSVLWDLLDIWKMKYIGPVVALAEIVDDEQNIHTEDVEKKTTDGVILLCKVPVPQGQKTLAEFEAALREILIPVKYDTPREMYAYLYSQKDAFSAELTEALKEAMKEKTEIKPVTGFYYIYKVSNETTDNDDASTETTEVLEAEEAEAEEAEAEGENAEEAQEAQAEGEVVDENAEAQDGAKALDAIYDNFKDTYDRGNWEYIYRRYYDKDVLEHFASAPLPSEVYSMLYACYYKAYYEKLYAAESKIKKTLEDMKEWGRRPSVMKKGENVYKATLRGLWAKIKTYEPELKVELTKRLFEEASEAVGLCADGHVGRLCNVMVGFDPEFTCSLSPMEYFQNTIALIAGNIHAPMSTKILQAKALMDEMKMPEEEREAWLEAL